MRTRFSLPIAHNPTSGSGIKLGQLKSVLTACLALADELAEGTIETIMGKSDIELAMDGLSGKLKR